MWKVCKTWLLSLLRLFVPRLCAVCGCALVEGEEMLCMDCDYGLPRTYYHLIPDNQMVEVLWRDMPLVRAAAYFFYRHKSPYARLIHSLKYKGRKDYAICLGRHVAAELLPSGFFEGIDVIVPVPLHPRKQRKRGYNQSECFAQGLSAVTGIPVDAVSVTRDKYTPTQTRKSFYERQDNMACAFSLRCPEVFAGKHVLIVDDVFTTGATVKACADALKGVESLRVSVLTMAKADS